MTNCNCRYNCIDLAIVASIIIGIIAAALSVTGVIALTPAFLWVVGGIAVVYLAVVLVIAAFRGFCGCRQILSVLLVGSQVIICHSAVPSFPSVPPTCNLAPQMGQKQASGSWRRTPQ